MLDLCMQSLTGFPAFNDVAVGEGHVQRCSSAPETCSFSALLGKRPPKILWTISTSQSESKKSGNLKGAVNRKFLIASVEEPNRQKLLLNTGSPCGKMAPKRSSTYSYRVWKAKVICEPLI